MEAMSVGNVLGTGFRVFFKNLPAFLLMTVLVYAPLIAWAAITLGQSGDDPLETLERMQSFNTWGVVLLGVLEMPLAAMLTYGVVAELGGQHASVGDCIATGVKRFVPALLIMLLIGLVVVATMIAMLAPAGASNSPAFVWIMIIGWIVLLVTLYARWFVIIPASVIERPGIFGAFDRSGTLTAARRLRCAALVVLMWGVHFAVYIGSFAILLPHFGDGDFATESLDRLPVFVIVQFALWIVFAALRAVFAATAYFYLRRDKEGTSAEELASVFS
ncbi:MAG: hypothetical protein KC464_31665 [Myxococcales bacterium]|nr:hypothetical protein [Myxococcales bacterium]